jgi:Zn-dependent peptidase ImmA (M78 family)
MTFNPHRLIVARKRRGLSRIALARLSGLGNRTLAYYESGDVCPSPEAIDGLAKALKFPEPFFSGPEMIELNPDGVSFRSLKAMTAAQRDMALAAATLITQLAKLIEKWFELPSPSLPSLRGFDPETAAQALRAEWGLGERPLKNVVHVLEVHGVRVFSLPVESSNIDAFSLWQDEIPYVFLNQQKSAERGRMDCGHELGHLTMHQHGAPRGRQAEVEADRFGAAFLMPASDVLANKPRKITLQAIHQLKLRWGVAAIALVHRLKTLNVLTEWQYRSLCIEISREGGRKHEKNGISRDFSQLLTKVFERLREEGVSRQSIARDLFVSSSELDSWLVGLTMTAVSGGLPQSNPRQPGRQSEQRSHLKII